ncbi:MAG: YaiI/YqxD family protein [Thermoanaerobaculia bacterium]|nr:YaiI/YqxD family protein [Thermoanaerobaculia bacterium]
MKILVDADACPVKTEVCRVAQRHALPVIFVANSRMAVPQIGSVRLQVVGGRFDAADDWIVEQAEASDVVISDDIPLASRCLEKGAWVLSPKGRRFTEDNIGDALATREILAQLRETGVATGGPAPFDRKHRSRFLESFEETLRAARRSKPE